MLNVALYQPEIPPNTGNLIRLCANSGATLHLIHPLGFELDEKRLRRAGLDYHEWTRVIEHKDYDAFKAQLPGRLIACETGATTCYADFEFQQDDTLLFGPETRGLTADMVSNTNHSVYIPMKENIRSINLCNSVSIILFEAWRQLGFLG
ncbi:MAG: tRNA (cytidine(34)-2'-O)-methyltransferase [marine bacterium B5-7]|nr:MAG: tRNA (cytidine(34)-2'-O)-methyltransferase [marine bacterium B5-7]